MGQLSRLDRSITPNMAAMCLTPSNKMLERLALYSAMAAIHEQPSNIVFFCVWKHVKKQHKSKCTCESSAICFVFAFVVLFVCSFSWYHFCTYENFYPSAIFAVRSWEKKGENNARQVRKQSKQSEHKANQRTVEKKLQQTCAAACFCFFCLLYFFFFFLFCFKQLFWLLVSVAGVPNLRLSIDWVFLLAFPNQFTVGTLSSEKRRWCDSRGHSVRPFFTPLSGLYQRLCGWPSSGSMSPA